MTDLEKVKRLIRNALNFTGSTKYTSFELTPDYKLRVYPDTVKLLSYTGVNDLMGDRLFLMTWVDLIDFTQLDEILNTIKDKAPEEISKKLLEGIE